MRAATTLHVPFVDLKAQYSGIREEVREAVDSVLDSAHFVGGESVEKFEFEFARYVGARYAVGVGSGTDAIQLALQAAGIGPGHEVIVPVNTFFATAEAVSNVGATPVFVDVDPFTFHLDPVCVRSAITPRTRAIVPVHLYGRAADLKEIEQDASSAGLQIIEDACQAHGVLRDGVKIGGSGRLTCFSFYPGKNLGAYGDGGAITCNDPAVARTLRLLRDHGSPSKYNHVRIGMNSRLDAIQAAVLTVKLRHLDMWNTLRYRHAEALVLGLGNSGIRTPSIPPEGEHNFHLFVLRCRQRDALKDFLRQRGIDTGIHYPVPLHLTLAYRQRGAPGPGSFPVAEALAGEILSLPMYPDLSREQIDHVVSSVQEFLFQAGPELADPASAFPIAKSMACTD